MRAASRSPLRGGSRWHVQRSSTAGRWKGSTRLQLWAGRGRDGAAAAGFSIPLELFARTGDHLAGQ